MSANLKKSLFPKTFICFKRTMNSTASQVPVKVKQGTVLGQIVVDKNNNSYISFKGIPYAVPPVGDLRFKPPVPLEKFITELLDCSKERDRSLQKDIFTGEYVGSEDCLYLNIYTPTSCLFEKNFRRKENSKNLPVMIWLHGGAFIFGSGNSDYYLPVYLIQENVIVVTLNYRLSMFGFLQLPEAGISGNAGLKDQLEAIKWVRENIASFNGDPKNVTLFGQSAGAASVHLHLLSENSKRYFDKAICQSGNSIMEWVMQFDAIGKARKLAELEGCPDLKNDKKILDFLKNRAEPNLLKHLLTTLNGDERRRGLPMPFKPTVEATPTADAIVTRPPLEACLELDSIDKPLMMGYTSSEGITMVSNAMKKLDELDKDLARLVPRSVNLDPNDSLCLNLAKKIRDFYFQGQSITMQKLQELTALQSDYHFGIGMHLAAEIHARKQHKSPLYFYRFSYDGEMNYYKKIQNLTEIKGACHADELPYLFAMDLINLSPVPGSKDAEILQKMCRLWTNFAKYGNPTPPEDQDLKLQWESVDNIKHDEKFSLKYLEIDQNIRMEKNPDWDRMEFWREVYRTYNKDFLKPKL